MSFNSRNSRILIVAVTCVAIGAGASAIATAGAATSPGKASAGHAARGGGLRRWERRAVQGSVVIDTKQGFKTVTFERGTVKSVSGQELTLVEGTTKAADKTVTLTIPTDAYVRDNRQNSTLASVTEGQRVTVLTGPEKTLVVARTPRRA